MEQYESYKDSGVEWIGKVPKHWGIGRMKYTGKFENGLIYSANDISDDSGKLVLRSSNIQSCRLNFTDCIYVHHAPDELMVQKGDIIICSRNGSVNLIGKCAYIENDMNATFGAFMLRYRPQIHSKFAFYLFQSVVSYYKGLFSTTTINQLTKEAIGQMKIPLVPDYEQQAIAAYLDKRCSEIDKAIATQQKRIALLQELKQSIITRAVTQGIHPDVPLKESGVEWIGKVPEHWEVRRLKSICQSKKYAVKTGPFGTQLKGQDLYPEGDIRVYNQRNVIDDNFNECSFYVTHKKASDLKSFYTQPNDLLITSRGTIGKCSILPDNVPMGILHPCLIAVRIDQKICTIEWAKLFIGESNCFATNIFLNSNATTIDVIYTDTLKNVIITIPPVLEQKKIIAYIDQYIKKLDSIIKKANKRIEYLQELRQSVITEAITGKIKVC